MEAHAATPVLFGLALLVLVAKAGGLAVERLGQPSTTSSGSSSWPWSAGWRAAPPARPPAG